MKEEITSLELIYLVKELQELIEGRIDKVYQRDREFLLTMHVRAKGKKFLKICPNAIYLTEHKEEFPETPPGFCKFLRKRLGSTTIKKIVQKNFERIVEITFEGKEEFFIMIIELFSNGNLVLCDKDYKVISALESHKWRDRTVRGGIEYEFPPQQKDTLSIDEKEFSKAVKTSDKDSVVKTLAVDFGLGGLYAEELCLLSKINKEKEELKETEIKTLYKYLKGLFSKKIKANSVGEEILPFELKTFGKEEKKYFQSFSEAIDSKFSKKIMESQKKESEDKKSEEVERVQLVIDQQEQTIDGLKLSAKENQRKGEFIYENYEQIKKLLDDLNTARKKYSWEEIKDKLKGHKIIKQISEKEGKITIEI
ncbi:fibronectin/fibrinogen-binding protein [Candidatus Woesearchaeota archaeon]|nr:fibronectin/fibrinogen-binding protein [Candidatus Woesearchaeota archaeon]